MEEKQLIIIDNKSTDPCISFFSLIELYDVVVTDTEYEVCKKGEGTTNIPHFTTKEKAMSKLKRAVIRNKPLEL